MMANRAPNPNRHSLIRREATSPSMFLCGPTSLAQVQRDQLCDTSRALAAFDLDQKAIVDAQAVGRHVLCLGDGGPPPQTGAGRDRREVADAVRAVVQRILQPLQPHHRSNEHRSKAEREKPVGDGLAAGQLPLRTVLVDMNPLLVAGGVGELIDPVLCDLDPVARADFGADGRFDLLEAVEYPHDRVLRTGVRSSFPELCPGWRARRPSWPTP